MFGAEKLRLDLENLGYKVEIVNGTDQNQYAVILDYEVLIGRFAGRIIDLGVLATNDYPRSVASAVHIKTQPQLLEKTDSVPNVRNIIDSALGTEWRYWSNNFNWNEERDTRRLISQINTIFKDA
ncbi:MAG TPA: E2/UBC family protein [Pyrinomonadaceae bacterium]|nr:E2/UBC family protein [Pyrinomonadaceae bacterium]